MGRLILFLLLLCSTVSAEYIRLDSLRVAVHRQVALPDSGNAVVSVAKTHMAINRAISQVCIDFPAVPKMDTVGIHRDSTGAALNTDFQQVGAVYRFKDAGWWYPLKPLAGDSLAKALSGTSENQASPGDSTDPGFYYTFDKRIYVHPKWSDSLSSDSLVIQYFGIGTKLTGGTDSTDVLPQFREAVIVYTCYQIEMMRNRFAAAAAYLEWYKQLR